MVNSFIVIRQDFGIKSKIFQKIYQQRALYYSSCTFYAQDLITILQVKIGFVLSKGFVYINNQHVRVIAVFNIGLKNFYHHIVSRNVKRESLPRRRRSEK